MTIESIGRKDSTVYDLLHSTQSTQVNFASRLRQPGTGNW
jgi:hypothetical protein